MTTQLYITNNNKTQQLNLLLLHMLLSMYKYAKKNNNTIYMGVEGQAPQTTLHTFFRQTFTNVIHQRTHINKHCT